MQRNEIGASEKFVQLDLGDAHLLGALLRKERVVGNDMHLQADGAGADDRADIASADNAERLAGDLDAHEFRLFPFAGLCRGIGCRKLAGDGEHQRDRMFGRRDRIAEGRVHDDDAAARSGRNIDIVDADAGAANDLQVRRRSDDLFRHLGGRADGQTIILADDFEQTVLVFAELRFEIDFDAAVAEDLDGGFRQFVGYENARCHEGLLQKCSAMNEIRNARA